VPSDAIHVSQEFTVSPERVFAALNDHANMGRWLGGHITVVKPAPDGGVGTVRRVHIGPAHFDEEVIEREIPTRLVYRITAGVPFLRHHRGEIKVEPKGTGSRVTWDVAFVSKLPGMSAPIRAGLGLVLRQGLKKLAKQLAR
jgi:uncharacterized protein YndB with AHSA1/START domain